MQKIKLNRIILGCILTLSLILFLPRTLSSQTSGVDVSDSDANFSIGLNSQEYLSRLNVASVSQATGSDNLESEPLTPPSFEGLLLAAQSVLPSGTDGFQAIPFGFPDFESLPFVSQSISISGADDRWFQPLGLDSPTAPQSMLAFVFPQASPTNSPESTSTPIPANTPTPAELDPIVTSTVEATEVQDEAIKTPTVQETLELIETQQPLPDPIATSVSSGTGDVISTLSEMGGIIQTILALLAFFGIGSFFYFRRSSGDSQSGISSTRQDIGKSKILTALSVVLNEKFNVAELKTLCFQLGIEYENFEGGKGERVIGILSYAQRHNRLQDVINYIKQNRLDINLPED